MEEEPVVVVYEAHPCTVAQSSVFIEERCLADLQSAGKLPVVHDRLNGVVVTEHWSVEADDGE